MDWKSSTLPWTTRQRYRSQQQRGYDVGLSWNPKRFYGADLSHILTRNANKSSDFPPSMFGSHKAVGLDHNVCVDRYSRYGAYGLDEFNDEDVPGFQRPPRIFWGMSIGAISNQSATSVMLTDLILIDQASIIPITASRYIPRSPQNTQASRKSLRVFRTSLAQPLFSELQKP